MERKQTRIAINGYGRIGRTFLRAYFEKKFPHLLLSAINCSHDHKNVLHLTKFDSTHGTLNLDLSSNEQELIIENHKIKLVRERNPELLPWKDLEIDVVVECTGKFNDGTKALAHTKSGAKKVLISAPATNVDATVVFGANHQILNSKMLCISNSSCTTNCLGVLLKPLNESLEIENGFITTIHAATNDQNVLDNFHQDLRRARSSFNNLIPTKTGAAKSIELIFPELKDKFDGIAVRVPTNNVSLLDLTFNVKKSISSHELNALIKEFATQDKLGVIEYSDLDLVSSDFNHNPSSCIFDATQTKVSKDQKTIKLLAWYDNEWGYVNRLLDVIQYLENI